MIIYRSPEIWGGSQKGKGMDKIITFIASAYILGALGFFIVTLISCVDLVFKDKKGNYDMLDHVMICLGVSASWPIVLFKMYKESIK